MTSPKLASGRAMRETLRRYLAEIIKYRRYFYPALLLPGIGSILAIFVPPLIISQILNIYQHTGTLTQSQFGLYISAFVVIWFLGEMLWRLSEWFNQQGQSRAMRGLYTHALAELLKRDITFFNDNFAGTLTKRALDYARNFEDVSDKLGKSFINLIITLIFCLVVLWLYSPWISIALVVSFVVTLTGSFYILRQRLPLVLQRNAAGNRSAGVLSDIIANMSAVKTFGREDDELRRYQSHVDTHMDATLRAWRVWNERHDMFISPMYVLANTVGLVLSMYFGEKYGVSAAAIFITFAYVSRLTRSLWDLGPLYQQLERDVSNAAEHVDAMMDLPQVQDPPNPQPLEVSAGSVEFQRVRFNYTDASKRNSLFSGLNLNIEPGEHIGLVGPSGGGKTTITKLLLRFMDLQDGQILIDGQDIASVRQQDLRRHIAYVPQEPLLFHRSLIDNIAFGKPKASKTEVMAAARRAHAHEFIARLPEGYDTLVGERGVKLSGGQRQRIAIARAILKDAPILVLDEATSALDSESEKLIQDALWRLMEGRTAIAIAHRLSTIQRMDRIIVLEEGRIAEQGSHRELLDRGGQYASLWSHQSGGFIDEDE